MKTWKMIAIIFLCLAAYVLSAKYYLDKLGDIKKNKIGLQRTERIMINNGLWPAGEPLPEWMIKNEPK